MDKEKLKKLKPPICPQCLYPPDPKRRLLFFNSPGEAIEFIINEPLEWKYPAEEIGVLLECPTYECKVVKEIESIEALIHSFAWNVKEIPEDSPEYKKRLIQGKIQKKIEMISLLKTIIEGGEPVIE